MYTSKLALLQPQIIQYGPGALSNLLPWLNENGYKGIFFLCDPSVKDKIRKIQVLCTKRGIDPLICTDVEPEPSFDSLEKVLREARLFNPDCMVGIGGGSALDLAKLVSVLIGGHYDITQILGKNEAPPRTIGLVQVPTTAGTGSEVTLRAIVSDPLTKAKQAVESTYLLADMVIVDPELTLTMPPSITAATGIDALAHCIEAYTNQHAHPLIDTYAIKGVSLIGTHLETAVTRGDDLNARAAMSLGSLYGGFCLGPVNTAAVHALAYPLNGEYDIAHGTANSLLLPHVMAYNLPACRAKTAELGRALGVRGSDEELSDLAVERIKNLTRAIGIPSGISELGIPREELSNIAKKAMQITRLLENNPRPLTYEDALYLYEKAY
ncbi:MAG: iron-containing alcohol dehydrogenase [Deltaproteobacteria bacterium]|nr:iron-containing alcohol dehydrogenase [Deltaproteobacteria bacterium]